MVIPDKHAVMFQTGMASPFVHSLTLTDDVVLERLSNVVRVAEVERLAEVQIVQNTEEPCLFRITIARKTGTGTSRQ